VSALEELLERLRAMPPDPELTAEEKRDPLVRKGFIWGSRVEVEEAIQILTEEAEYEAG
jgi:hypothetical protein